MEQIQKQEDSIKKGKILLLSLFILLTFFFNTTPGPFYPIFANPFFVACFYGIIAFVGFLWSLSFKVNARILLLIAPQVALLVFSNILFLNVFFNQALGRLYETLLMVVLLIVFFLLTHIVFITSNVFAVSSFKKIPLEAVAKTTIYIISSLSFFFLTYGLLALEISVMTSMILLVFLMFFAIFLLLSHFYLEISTVFSNTFLVFWSILLILFSVVFFSSRVEFIALVVTAVFYYSVGIFIGRRGQLTDFKIVEYVIILLLIAFFSYYFSLF